MKFNIKSRKGFTLIELLVVIGILAVLAAIAIPSVAGLIDRANVSADKTNSNEMTNAIERFASEYELFCQDIASGTFDKDNMDSAQGRVYNVLGIEDRAGIEFIEVDADEPVDDDDIAIYRDTKYPANAKTAQLIVQNYTKTSSSTFEPKQSDMHYWYSPDCGVVVFAEPNADQNKESKLNSQIISGIDAKGNPVGPNTKWINLTDNSYTTLSHSNVIPKGGTYYVGVTDLTLGNYSTATKIYTAGENFPNSITKGDIYVYGDYEYRFNCWFNNNNTWTVNTGNTGHWGVRVLDSSKLYYGNILEEINGKVISSLSNTFSNCANLRRAPAIPETVRSLDLTFRNCTNLVEVGSIPQGVTQMVETFRNCESLSGDIIIHANPNTMSNSFSGIRHPIYLSGNSTKLNELAATDGHTDLGPQDYVKVK